MPNGKFLFERVDQVMKNFFRNIVVEQGCRKSGIKSARTHVEDVRADGSGEIGCQRVLEFKMFIVIAVERALADFSVRVLHQG